MGQIKVVLLFNEDDERQREAGEYLKTKKRCKTVLVTELVHSWLKNQRNNGSTILVDQCNEIENIKKSLLQDSEFILQIEKSMHNIGTQKKDSFPEKKDEGTFDLDEDMMLAGLSMFEADL